MPVFSFIDAGTRTLAYGGLWCEGWLLCWLGVVGWGALGGSAGAGEVLEHERKKGTSCLARKNLPERGGLRRRQLEISTLVIYGLRFWLGRLRVMTDALFICE